MNEKKLVCTKDKCNGCYLCLSVCKNGAVDVRDELESFNSYINPEKCINCGMCVKSCPANNAPVKTSPKYFYQGWSKNPEVRRKSSSGGIATEIAQFFVEDGGVCCSCGFNNGQFIFRFAENPGDVKRFSGSKYVKSNPAHIYEKIKKYIQVGRKVLFIGLPCQSAAVQSYIGKSELLFTCDLICHGTPSVMMVEKYLEETGKALGELTSISFRQKDHMYVSGNGVSIEPEKVLDKYTMAFLRGLDYTSNCYSCQYASFERVSDITLGDSWGTELSNGEQAKGISLILCQNEKGEKLIRSANVHLCDVNIEKAIAFNRQLKTPSIMPKERRIFFDTMKKNGKFCRSVRIAYPKDCFRQTIKKILFDLGIRKV